ncbi:DUF3224 domain-containing protein [Propioniciclava coleopterorum]|uniref:DUF3224 domain-containing protein n=1 Tax=Propioniciclava coleopterorum TaxID=2714937 RepID=A0A6G7Y9J1_9ACTN|nr:DUF3224 domain-containing protein [Propioniciclava coleopterorum]QIK73475.1 DUF3224 domain-containing protein [Propioniciclava coleopterorum]
MTTTHAQGTFDIDMRPTEPVADGRIGRFDLSKNFHGDLSGTAEGVMLAVGDPTSGNAGYVALEVLQVEHDGRSGTFALQQFGKMRGGESTLDYIVAPGSGTGDFAGIGGVFTLTVDADGVHHYDLAYELPE